MRAGKRALLCVYALLTLAMGLAFGALGYMILFRPYQLDRIRALVSENTVLWAFVAGLFALAIVVLSLYFLFFRSAQRQQPQSRSVLLKTTDIGMTRVSIDALDSLVHRAVKGFNVVRDCQSTIVNNDDNISVRLKIVLVPDAVMPDITQRLQQEVQEYVQTHSGISVRDVMIYVDSPPPSTAVARVE